MNRIISPLRPEMRGTTVADLQEALKLLLDRGAILRDDEGARRELTAVLAREHSTQTYGGTTRKLVGIFQETHHLDVRIGEVDERTAVAFNAALEDLGVFDTPAEIQKRVVAGQVRHDDGSFVGGVSVTAFNQTDREALRLGESRTDDSGHYRIRYDVPVGSQLRLRVEVNDPNGRRLATSDVIGDPRPTETVDLIVPRSDRKQYVVSGTVTSQDRPGINGLRVLVVDKNVGGDATVAEMRTDDEGVYRAVFDDSAFGRRGKQRPDLQVRALAEDGAVLGRSAIQYNASTNTTLDVVLDEKAAEALPSEYDVLTGALSSQFDGRLEDLQENDQQQDITYLANKTGWDARAVAMASLADQFSARTADATGARSIAQPMFYALFRAGLPANETALFQTDIKTVRSVWTAAMAQGVISPASGANVEEALTCFQDMGVAAALKSPAVVGTSSWKEMLSTSRLSDDQQAMFTRLYNAQGSDPDALWTAVSEALGHDVAARLQVDGKLGLLTINNAPLMTKLHSTAFAAGATDTLQLAQAGYHRPSAWSALLTADVPVPREVSGDTDAARRDNYAAFLAAQVRLTYPTASVAHMVKSGDVVLPNAPAGASDDVHGFLTEHQGRFEIGVQPVEQYIAHNQVEAADVTVQQVKRLQRAYQLTPSDQALAGLMRRGVDSAYEVVRYEKEAFVGAFAKDLGGADQAAATFDKAAQVHNAVLNIALSYLHARTAPAIGVHSPPNSIDPTPACRRRDRLCKPGEAFWRWTLRLRALPLDSLARGLPGRPVALP
ncbi:MAG: hypothetical protein IPK19_27800 [Chloroflexi bacterium]|nr:hypothetical protein [Chloroflexota bacterium]